MGARFLTGHLWPAVLITTLIVLAGAVGGADPSDAARSQAAARLYLPAAPRNLAGSGPATPATPTAPGSSGALWLPFRTDDGGVAPTYGLSVAVDPAGGVHAAYAIYAGTAVRPATYAYCAAECGNKANWSFTRLTGSVHDVRLALDPAGHPRLMLFGPVPGAESGRRMRYEYATCEAGCTDPAAWTFATLAAPIEAVGTREYNNNRYFALGPQGHPAFVHTDTVDGHSGTFYLSCGAAPAAACASASNWTETKLASTVIGRPSLAFTLAGQPRLAFDVYSIADLTSYLWYGQCDRDCPATASWSYVLLNKTHGTAVWSLRSDAQGRPRMAVYSGAYATAPFQDHRLYYLWCDAGCAEEHRNWIVAPLGLPTLTGDGVDLALDRQDRPRMAFETASRGLGYAWCDAACETAQAVWRSREVEPAAALDNDFEVLPMHRCTISKWFNGNRASLVLDRAGNPRIGHDAEHWWYGHTNDQFKRDCNYKDATVTRIALFDQP
jgi:hypothetical protein